MQRACRLAFQLVSAAAFVWPLLLLVPIIAQLNLIDFHVFWVAGGRWLAHGNPYTGWQSLTATFAYPAPAAAIFAPLSQLPYAAASGLYVAALILALVGALWLLEVRDWRLYMIALAAPPFLSGVAVGAISALLALAAAACWRWRNRPLACGLIVAAAIVAKLFLWPLLLWLIVTRRYRAAFVAAGSGIAATVIAWGWIGFQGLAAFPGLLGKIAGADGASTWQTAWQLLGVHTLAGLKIAAVAFAIVYLARAGRLPERESFILATLAALALSPIVWLHYFVLLIPVIALRQPRLGSWWLILPSFYLTTSLGHWRAPTVLAILAVLALALRGDGAERQIQVARPDREIVPRIDGLRHRQIV